MRVETTRPWDLAAVTAWALLTVAVVALDPWQPLRVVLGLPFVLFLPGYALVAALFPERHRVVETNDPEAPSPSDGHSEDTDTIEEGIDGLERVALSLGLSIAVVPLIGLGLNYTPWGIRLTPILAALTVFILAASATAAWRRQRLPEDERLQIAFQIAPPDWQNYSTLDKVLTVALALSIVFAIGTLGYVLTTPRDGERFTELYILGPDGKATNYPTNLTVNETGQVILGVTNLEHRTVNYTIEMIDQRGQFVNETGNRTFVAEENETMQGWRLQLEHNETWEENVTFAMEEAGTHRALWHLTAEHRENEDPYRRVHLFVNVTAEEG